MLVTLRSQKVNSLTMFANCQLPVVCLQPVEILIVTHFIWIIHKSLLERRVCKLEKGDKGPFKVKTSLYPTFYMMKKDDDDFKVIKLILAHFF